jgi:ribonuclease HII
MTTSSFELEKSLLENDYKIIIGIDEAGRGPLAGPVVASAVCIKNCDLFIDKDKRWDFVRDSKKLAEKKREEIFEFIFENFYVGVGISNEKTIDDINILEATYLAMKKAIGELLSEMRKAGVGKEKKTIIIVDGNKLIPNLSIEQKAIVSGDNVAKTISAASIIAKVTRDRIMMECDQKWPGYKFANHKGYGTRAHIEALKKLGACDIHRKTFAPVKNM